MLGGTTRSVIRGRMFLSRRHRPHLHDICAVRIRVVRADNGVDGDMPFSVSLVRPSTTVLVGHNGVVFKAVPTNRDTWNSRLEFRDDARSLRVQAVRNLYYHRVLPRAKGRD